MFSRRGAPNSIHSFRGARRSLAHLATRSEIPNNSLAMTDSYGNFDLVKRIKLDFTDVEVTRWRSRETGLNIVHLDYEGAHICYFISVSSSEMLSCSAHREGLLRRED